MMCRRGGIQGSDVGAIRVARTFSVVEIAADAATTFARATRDPDPRDPRVKIQPMSGDGGASPEPSPAIPPERPSRARTKPNGGAPPPDRPSRTRKPPPSPGHGHARPKRKPR
jgi:ATP-dependent RNA helicase DeaD